MNDMDNESIKQGTTPKKYQGSKSPRPVPHPTSENPSTSGGKTKK